MSKIKLNEPSSSPPLVWATPLIGIILFIVAMSAFFYTLHEEDLNQAQQRTIHDVELARQTLRTRLLTVQERLMQIAHNIEQDYAPSENFERYAKSLLSDIPEVSSVLRINTNRIALQVTRPLDRVVEDVYKEGQLIENPETYRCFYATRNSDAPIFSKPFPRIETRGAYIEIQAPWYLHNEFQGTVVATVPLDELLHDAVPTSFTDLYHVRILNEDGEVMATNSTRAMNNAKLTHEVPLDPPGYGLKLRAVMYRSTTELFSNMLAWAVIGLSAVIVWSFIMLFRHAKLRSDAERRLLAETKFRRAMEDSVITGMRAIDMAGRITYVNPAFCKMTGFTEEELVGSLPPFPYWPENSFKNERFLELILTGQVPTDGVEVQVRRKDRTLFDAQLYVSPLINADGKQAGWMTSMTDITEPLRIREELAAAHRRFVRILEELDAAVCVQPPELPDNVYIFANKLHREWFQEATPPRDLGRELRRPHRFEPFEWQNPISGRWFEVRRRAISWVDGATVTMQVATDISSRKEAEKFSRQQQEKLQFTSRLITLGELASSLAHEINQPLAAISNYNIGCINRLKSGKVTPEDLLPILEKTNAQAKRASDVIRRIRAFVKQQEPKRTHCEIQKIVSEAIDFCRMGTRLQFARIDTHFKTEDLVVLADPILIEQVLMNLIRNGVEAMQHLSPQERCIVISVEQQGKFANVQVTDKGTGVPDEIKERLFESFFTTKSDGMGMGLNICRTIIEYHQGQLWVESAPEGGSTFQFTLPLVSALPEASVSSAS